MPRAAAVLLHPHPDMGGDRFNNVVSELYRALPPAGVTAIRFDFSSSKIDVSAEETIEALDPRHRTYYWIEEGQNEWEPHDRSDYQAVRDGYVSVTPLQVDLTHRDQLDLLRRGLG